QVVPLRGGRLHAPPGESRSTATTTQRTRITLASGLSGSQSAGNFLPMPYPAQTVSVGGDWLTDKRTLMTYSPSTSLSGLSYSVTSKEPAPTEQQLQRSLAPPADIASADLFVPATFAPLAALARQITQGRASSYGRAVALQRWFTTGHRFTYSLAVGYAPGTSLGKGRWQVKTGGAHAWPELYFQGAGWLRFEPTPAGSGGQDT